jgi:hypothetical protein
MNATSITYLIILFCICTIHAYEFKFKLQDVEMEFIWEPKNVGILPKLSEFFYDDEIEGDLFNVDESDGEDDSSYYEEIEEEYNQIRKYFNIKSIHQEYDNISEEYRAIAEKLCLFTVLTKETTISYKESVRT